MRINLKTLRMAIAALPKPTSEGEQFTMRVETYPTYYNTCFSPKIKNKNPSFLYFNVPIVAVRYSNKNISWLEWEMK